MCRNLPLSQLGPEGYLEFSPAIRIDPAVDPILVYVSSKLSAGCSPVTIATKQNVSQCRGPKRKDLRCLRAVTNLTIRYPAAAACLPASATTPLRAAALGEQGATRKRWAADRNADWSPLEFQRGGYSIFEVLPYPLQSGSRRRPGAKVRSRIAALFGTKAALRSQGSCAQGRLFS